MGQLVVRSAGVPIHDAPLVVRERVGRRRKTIQQTTVRDMKHRCQHHNALDPTQKRFVCVRCGSPWKPRRRRQHDKAVAYSKQRQRKQGYDEA